MNLLPMGPGTATPLTLPANGSGNNGRFKYIAPLRGFAMLPREDRQKRIDARRPAKNAKPKRKEHK